MNGKQLVDYMLVRYGRPESDAEARAACLVWLQHAYRQLSGLRRWSWLRAYDNLSALDGQQVYVLPANVAVVLDVYNKAGEPLRKVYERNWRFFFQGDESAGAPLVWAMLDRKRDEEQLRVGLWPKPGEADAGDYEYIYEPVEDAIADDEVTQYLMPANQRHVLADGALVEMSRNEGRLDMVDTYMSAYNNGLEALVQRDNELQRGRV